MDGWIRLHRQILDWRWYSDINVTRLFIHLLLKANFEPKDWQTTEIKRGELVTSLNKLAVETGLSVKVVRTCLDKLKKTGEILTKGANKFTTITICKYDSYQFFSEDKGKQRANKGQTKGKQRATTKEYNNIIKKESNNIESGEINSPAPSNKPTLEEREQNFYNEVAQFVGKYNREILRAFFDYWSEPNKQKNKMRFELQKTWDTARRLSTWAKREENNFSNSKNNSNGNNQSNNRKNGLSDEEIREAVAGGFALYYGSKQQNNN